MADTPDPEDRPADAGYTAVVYFHGMGNQRRYEESSRLIDAIDAYLSNIHKETGSSNGMLAGIKPRIEPDRVTDDKTVTYIRTRFFIPGQSRSWEAEEVRVYEAYWAPVMAGMRSPVAVAKWILSQVRRPFQTLRSPWRGHQRLRRSALADLMERRDRWPEGTRPDDFDKLLRVYADFEQLDAQRTYPAGDLAEFRRFLAESQEKRPDTALRLRRLADAWHRHYHASEYRNILFLFTILLTLVLLCGLLIWSVLLALQLIADLHLFDRTGFFFADYLRDRFNPSVSTAAGLVASAAGLLGLGRFLTAYMGDVEAWATYEETDEKHVRRSRVLDLATALCEHVFSDPRCRRVVVVSHSLGTSVAHDTLLALARKNRATNAQDPISGPVPLEKLSHFVTIASPIDKISYFFENTRSQYHRYTRVVEELRGDISDAPFSKNRHPHAHWVNFWDQADIISGALHSPVGRKSFESRVDNVHVANLHAPDPGASHSAYFRNRMVIARLFEMIYLGKHGFADLPMREDGEGYDYDSAMLGPGEPTGLHRHFFTAAMSVPWLGLLYLVLFFLGFETVSTAVLALLLLIVFGLVSRFALQYIRGMRQTL